MKKCVFYFVALFFVSLSVCCFADDTMSNDMLRSKEFPFGCCSIRLPFTWVDQSIVIDESNQVYIYKDDRGAFIYGFQHEKSDVDLTSEYVDSICLKYTEPILKYPLSRQLSFDTYDYDKEHPNRIAEYSSNFLEISCYASNPHGKDVLFFILIDIDGTLQRDYARILDNYRVNNLNAINSEQYEKKLKDVSVYLSALSIIIGRMGDNEKIYNSFLEYEKRFGKYMQDFSDISLSEITGDIDEEYRTEKLNTIREGLYTYIDFLTE